MHARRSGSPAPAETIAACARRRNPFPRARRTGRPTESAQDIHHPPRPRSDRLVKSRRLLESEGRRLMEGCKCQSTPECPSTLRPSAEARLGFDSDPQACSEQSEARAARHAARQMGLTAMCRRAGPGCTCILRRFSWHAQQRRPSTQQRHRCADQAMQCVLKLLCLPHAMCRRSCGHIPCA